MFDWGINKMNSAQLPSPTKIQSIAKWLLTNGGASLAWLKNIKLTRSRKILASLVTLIGLIASVIGIFTDYPKIREILFGSPTETQKPRLIIIDSSTATPNPRSSAEVIFTATPDPIRTATKDEILILISEFYYSEGNTGTDIHREIQREILAQAQAAQIEHVRVEIYPIAIPSNDVNLAEAIGEKYRAALVIWGADTGVRVQAHMLSVGAIDTLISEMLINETWCSRVANPEAYVTFVTDDLPAQLSFFSLLALSRAQYFEDDLQGSLHTLETAMELLEGEKTIYEGLDKAFFHLGLLYDDLGNSQKALEYYSQSIDLSPTYGYPFSNRGMLYHNMGDYEAALADYNRALELDPEDFGTYNNRGNVYLNLGEYEAALADFNKAIELSPYYSLAYGNRGILYHNMGDYEAALADYNRALEIDPEDSTTYSNRGIYYHNMRDYEAAMADYNKAIELDPEGNNSFRNRGTLYYHMGDYDAALADYNRAIEIDPENSSAYLYRGNLYLDLGEYEAALADYNRALELDPQDSVTYGNRGALYHELENYEAALADYNKVIELSPSDSLAYSNRGILYHEIGDYEAALADYDKTIELDPEDSITYNNRGILYYDMGNYEAALADYNQALELDPTFSYAYLMRGFLYLTMERLDPALEDFEQAAVIDPEGYETMNGICWDLGIYQHAELALPYCNLAVELDDTPWSRDARGLVNALLGNYAEAIADFEAFVTWAEEEGYSDWILKRHGWIVALANNINPFTDEVLEALKDE